MTTAAPDVDDRADLRTSVVLVSLVVVVHLVMAYFVSALTDDLFDLLIELSGQQLALMIVTVLPAIPLAVAVLSWARDRILGSIACLVVVATGLVPYVRNTIDVRLVEAGKLNEMQTYVEWSNWTLVVVLPVGAALGWGIARRRGSSWWPGILVVRRCRGPVLLARGEPVRPRRLRPPTTCHRPDLPRGPGLARRHDVLVARGPAQHR